MSDPDYLIRKARESESALLREMVSREYDVSLQKNGEIKPDDPAGKIVPAAAAANLVITRTENFSFKEIEGFFKKNVSTKAADLEKQNPFQPLQPFQRKDGTGNVVQSTALQFNEGNGAGVLFASNGAPESLSGQSGETRSMPQQNGWGNRALMV
ncbi:MAG: hypothetical protein ACJ8G3_26175 [Burkholderiaceae bacterium]